MKPCAFDYRRVNTLDEALTTLSDIECDIKVLAGGQSLLPLLNMRLARPELLLDINEIAELYMLKNLSKVDGTLQLEVGALVRQRQLERYCAASNLSSQTALISSALSNIGHPQTRNQGTVGGSLVHADASAELPLVLLTLGGTVTLRSTRGERILDAQDFFLSHYSTAIAADELLVKSTWPLPSLQAGIAFKEFRRRHGDFAMLSAACWMQLDEQQTIQNVRLGMGGAAETPILVDEVQELVSKQWTAEQGQQIAAAVAARLNFEDDVHASADYRQHLTIVLISHILEAAHKDAQAKMRKQPLNSNSYGAQSLPHAAINNMIDRAAQERATTERYAPAGSPALLTLRVNGRACSAAIEPRMLLSDFLRNECGLTGTHVGCEHGVCGSCTVVVDGIAIRSCLMLAISAENKEITTTEGLTRHPSFPALYRAFTEHHALQCGFCTPGIIASTLAELVGQEKSEAEIVDVLSGHLCRCTGYLGIKEAMQELVQVHPGG